MRLPGSVTASEREFRVHQHHVCSCKGGGSVPARLGDKRATSTPAGTWSVHPCGREEEGDTRHVGFPDQCAQRARGGGRAIHQYLGTGASRPVSVWPAFPSSGVSRANRAFGLTCSRASMGQRTRDRCPKRSQSETVSRGSVSRSGVRGHLRAPDGLSIWWTGSGVAHFRRSSSPGGRSPQRAPRERRRLHGLLRQIRLTEFIFSAPLRPVKTLSYGKQNVILWIFEMQSCKK